MVEERPSKPKLARRYKSLELTSENFKDNMPSIERPSILELKQLPAHLKYTYLGDCETLLVIISTYLTSPHEENLSGTLKRHRKAIGWQMANIKGHKSNTLFAQNFV